MELTVRRSRLARHLHKHEHTEINLTSMIDMMTILVFFLLVHGGFVRLAVLQLNLPSAQSAAQPEPPAFELEITVREASIEIGDRSTGLINRIEKTDSGLRPRAAHRESAAPQGAVPRHDDAPVLVEPYVSYEVLVAVMDRVRVAEERDAVLNRVNRVELFPQVSVGNAPTLIRGRTTMLYLGRSSRIVRNHHEEEARPDQPGRDDRHADGARVLPARVLDGADHGGARSKGSAAAAVDFGNANHQHRGRHRRRARHRRPRPAHRANRRGPRG